MGGDFNVVLKLEEKQGRSNKISALMHDFGCFLSENDLIDIPAKNGLFTWSNKRDGGGCINEKLYRFLFSQD